jgi:hypothetical protein
VVQLGIFWEKIKIWENNPTNSIEQSLARSLNHQDSKLLISLRKARKRQIVIAVGKQ